MDSNGETGTAPDNLKGVMEGIAKDLLSQLKEQGETQTFVIKKSINTLSANVSHIGNKVSANESKISEIKDTQEKIVENLLFIVESSLHETGMADVVWQGELEFLFSNICFYTQVDEYQDCHLLIVASCNCVLRQHLLN